MKESLPTWGRFLDAVAEWLKETNDPRLIITKTDEGITIEMKDVCACCADFCHAMAESAARHERN